MRLKYKMLFFLLGIFVLFPTSYLWAYCDQDNYLGITSEKPIVSTVDVSSSSSYSSTSTSGTSGCPNWDFAMYLEEARKKFIARKFHQILEESAQGMGTHLVALGHLMGCISSEHQTFGQVMKNHYPKVVAHLSSASKPHIDPFLKDMKKWIKEHPHLQNTCFTLG